MPIVRKSIAESGVVMQQTHRRRLRMPPDVPPPDLSKLVLESWAARLVGCKVGRLRELRNSGNLSCWRGPNNSCWYHADELATLFRRTHEAGRGEVAR